MGFGAHAGARLETKRTFDHWAMIGYMAGGEERKHPTFRIESIEENEVVFSIPHRVEAGEGWRRIHLHLQNAGVLAPRHPRRPPGPPGPPTKKLVFHFKTLV